jgi:hypothetical protein
MKVSRSVRPGELFTVFRFLDAPGDRLPEYKVTALAAGSDQPGDGGAEVSSCS